MSLFIEFGILLKLDYSKPALVEPVLNFGFGKHSSFLLEKCLAEGDTLLIILFNFSLEYVITKVRVNKRILKDERCTPASGLR